MRNDLFRLLIVGCLALAGCTAANQPPPVQTGEEGLEQAGAFSDLPARPADRASSAFWQAWGDGQAELSGYRAVVSRYGALREAELVLIYVTEPMDRRTWIKDDAVEEPDRVNVLKLNESLKFLTGIYPYSVMTSVFAPVDGWRAERFAPVKLSMSVQEWCGHLFHEVWPGAERFRSLLLSYFAQEGERVETVPTEANTLYEDALLIQLRELDGSFNEGQDWAGQLVPALWNRRTAHDSLRPVPARILRTEADRDGRTVNRFVLTYGDYTRTFDVEREMPRRVLGWTTSRGEAVALIRTERLPYWQLNKPGDESYRARIGVDPEQPGRRPADS